MSNQKKSPVKTATSKVTAPLKKQQPRSKIWHAILAFFNIGQGKRQPSLIMGGKQDAWRYLFIWAIMTLGFVMLAGKAVMVQIFPQEEAVQHGKKQVITTRTLQAHRGLILDRSGIPLAANAPLQTISLNPKAYADLYHSTHKKLQRATDSKQKEILQATLDKIDLVKIAALSNISLEELKKVTNLDKKISYHAPDVDEQIENILPKGKGSYRFVLLKRVPPEVAAPLMELNTKNILNKEVYFQRYYLQAEPNAQILGYMGHTDDPKKSAVGVSGLEARYNSWLAGKSGKMLVLRDKNNQPIREIQEVEPLVEGKALNLTIDSRLQYILYKSLEQVGRQQLALSSSGMVVDVRTGEVLAMASWPSFNSNNLSDIHGVNERNRPVMDMFEPGSVMKPFTVAAALESGEYTTSSLIQTSPGSLYVGGYTIKDGGDFGAITLAKLIQKSSNIASSKIALQLPADAIVKMQKNFGFGEKTQLQLPSEMKGVLEVPNQNSLARRATLSYGYGQQVTLAQLVQAYATLANQGVMQPLNIVQDVDKAEPRRVISAKHAKEIVNMMELVTQEGGTGKAAAINGYRVAGKTGTSRRSNPEGGYYSTRYRTIFAGIAPVSNPRFAVAILVEDPQVQKYAGQVSAPVFKEVMKEALRLYNVPYDKPLYVEN